MEKEAEEKAIEEKKEINYEEKIEHQSKIVKELEDSYKKNATDELRLELDRETDLLRHYTNAAKGNPKQRAKQAAESAGKITLNRAVQQVEPEQSA